MFENTPDRIDRNYLNTLHEKYVITVVDKAPNNLIVMCKKLFLITLCKELGININTNIFNGNDIYKPVNIPVTEILEHFTT